MRRTVSAAGIAVVVAVVAGPATTGQAATRGPRVAGCRPGRVAVAHFAGHRALRRQPPHGPVPCGVTTGFAGAESHIVTTGSGAVVFTPAVVPSGLAGTGEPSPAGASRSQTDASPAGVAVTHDNGAHWSLVKPFGITWNPTDHGDYVDPATGRWFFEDYGPIPLAPQLGAEQEGPAHIMWTDDDGKTWTHTAVPDVVLPENPRFTSARPPAGQPTPTGYPDVLYLCANTNVGFTSPVIAGRLCFDSLDGGSTWRQRSVLFTGTVPQHSECGGDGEEFTAVDGFYPQPTHNGFLYVMVACGGHVYLARSTDEAASFPVLHRRSGAPVTLPVAASDSPELRIGSDGTMYLVYQRTSGSYAASLLLRVSRDHGLTWTRPLDVTAPSVSQVLQWSVAQRGVGELAFSYLGRHKGQTTWDAYLTATRDAGAALRRGRGPLFWSAVLNDPRRPLLYGDSVKGAGYLDGPGGVRMQAPFPFGIQGAGNDFIGATIAADGTPWGSFDEDCGPSPDSAGCRADGDQTRGFAGRLVWR